jgi:hypothetical protein
MFTTMGAEGYQPAAAVRGMTTKIPSMMMQRDAMQRH